MGNGMGGLPLLPNGHIDGSFRLSRHLNDIAMNIDRRGFLATSSSALLLGKTTRSPDAEIQSDTPEVPELTPRIQGRTFAVYATAENTDHRLSATETLAFKPMGQPLETQICVFVDPATRFQTMLGIGGALTDASAEVFAKLPQGKQ